jgi:hypothetical protein
MQHRCTAASTGNLPVWHGVSRDVISTPDAGYRPDNAVEMADAARSARAQRLRSPPEFLLHDLVAQPQALGADPGARGRGHGRDLGVLTVRPGSAITACAPPMHPSQMYTPGPAISFLTCFWLLPQNEHARKAPEAGISPLYLCSCGSQPATFRDRAGARRGRQLR